MLLISILFLVKDFFIVRSLHQSHLKFRQMAASWLGLLLLAARNHGVVTADLPRSAPAPLRSGARSTL